MESNENITNVSRECINRILKWLFIIIVCWKLALEMYDEFWISNSYPSQIRRRPVSAVPPRQAPSREQRVAGSEKLSSLAQMTTLPMTKVRGALSLGPWNLSAQLAQDPSEAVPLKRRAWSILLQLPIFMLWERSWKTRGRYRRRAFLILGVWGRRRYLRRLVRNENQHYLIFAFCHLIRGYFSQQDYSFLTSDLLQLQSNCSFAPFC